MKIVFNRQSLINTIAPIMCAVSGKSANAATEGILINAEAPSTVILTSYDLEKGVRTQMESDVFEGGDFVINAQKLLQTVKVMNGDTITLSVNEKLNVTITSGKSTYRMSAIQAADFPALPPLKTQLGFTLRSDILRKMIGKVMYAMGVNDQRMILNGTYFKVSDTHLLTVACDGFRMAKCEYPIDFGHIEGDDGALHHAFVVPNKTINELYRMLPDDDEKIITVYMGRKHMVYMIGELTFFTRLIEGEYIDYDRIVITNHRIKFSCPKNELLMALEKSAIVTEERILGAGRTHVKLSLESGLLKITADSSMGSSYDEIPTDHTGEDIVIAFNNRYLLDSVRSCESENITLEMSTPLTSVNVLPEPNDGSELYFLLPVRMKN